MRFAIDGYDAADLIRISGALFIIINMDSYLINLLHRKMLNSEWIQHIKHRKITLYPVKPKRTPFRLAG